MKNIDETLEHDKKVLSEREDLIIRNMLISSIGSIKWMIIQMNVFQNRLKMETVMKLIY